MAATRVTTVWTVFLNAIFKLLSVLGFTASPRGAATTAGCPASPSGLIPAQAGTRTRVRAATLPAPRSAEPLERSLPPTIKQRIQAEAHGSSPSVRRISLLGGDWLGGGLPAADTPAAEHRVPNDRVPDQLVPDRRSPVTAG